VTDCGHTPLYAEGRHIGGMERMPCYFCELHQLRTDLTSARAAATLSDADRAALEWLARYRHAIRAWAKGDDLLIADRALALLDRLITKDSV